MRFKAVLYSVCLALLSLQVFSATIENVVAQQRYPWNGLVDISFEVVGDPAEGLPEGKVAELSVEMTNKATGKKYTATNLTGDTEPIEGAHRVVWDLTAQGVQVYAPEVVFTVACHARDPLYRVIDVSEGSGATSYSVLELEAIPDGGWSDDYKTDKIVLRRIDGTNGVYYAGVFEITEAQWERVMGGTSTSTYPKYWVPYNSIRGNADTYDWPTTDAVDATSFIGKLRQKTGLATLDLPNEAEWEFAARAGVTTKWLCGDSETDLAKYAWYNSGDSNHPVGEFLPNAWGLYDVLGNVWEWCLDRQSNSNRYRVRRGGGWNSSASYCAFASREGNNPSWDSIQVGFRLFCRPTSN